MTKAEALEKNRSEQEIIRKKDEKRKQRKKKLSFICLVGVAVSLLVGIIGNAIILRGEKSEVLSGNTGNVSEAVLSDQDVFTTWVATNYFNDPNCLMSGGMFFKADDLQVQPDENVTKMLLTYDGQQITFLADTCSYINRNGDLIVYRNDKDRKLYEYSVLNGTSTVLYDGNVGESILYKGKIYFQDLDDSNRICLIDINDVAREKKATSALDTAKFFLYNDSCVYLTSDNQVYNLDLENNVANAIDGNYSSMFFNGKLLLQSGDRIISANADGNDASILYEGSTDFQFVGADENGVFVVKNGTLCKEPIGEGTEILYNGDPGELTYSLLSSGDEVYGVTYKINEQGSYTAQCVQFNRNGGE